MPRKIFFISWKMPFISLLRRLSYCPPAYRNSCFYYINQQHMLCCTKKKRFFNPLVQLKELPLLNRNKKELITTACEQLSSTEGAPTVTRSLVSLRSSFDLELTARREILKNPISCPVLRTWLKREKKTGLKEISLSTIELHFYTRTGF